MSTASIHLTAIPIKGHEGNIWNRLHSEREDICEAMAKALTPNARKSSAFKRSKLSDTNIASARRQLMEWRLRKVDDALDRLMSGSFGHCSKCGKPIDESKLDLDPAMAFCTDCWVQVQEGPGTPAVECSVDKADSISRHEDLTEGIALETQRPYDTICIQTNNSDYRIMLLDPKSGRALVQGGRYFSEPIEATVLGSSTRSSAFRAGWIGVGFRIEVWAEDKLFSTSAVKAIQVEHSAVDEADAEMTVH
jgi:RNA polymerase-binding transcription factor DksA